MGSPFSALFSISYTTFRTSATNCARIYNEGLTNDTIDAFLPADWQTSLKIDVEDIWNGFFIHALLINHRERGIILELDHQAKSQALRLQPALQACNRRMAGTGQEAWNHACDCCCYIHAGDDGEYCTCFSACFCSISIAKFLL